jgi:hypothetical protein
VDGDCELSDCYGGGGMDCLGLMDGASGRFAAWGGLGSV